MSCSSRSFMVPPKAGGARGGPRPRPPQGWGMSPSVLAARPGLLHPGEVAGGPVPCAVPKPWAVPALIPSDGHKEGAEGRDGVEPPLHLGHPGTPDPLKAAAGGGPRAPREVTEVTGGGCGFGGDEEADLPRGSHGEDVSPPCHVWLQREDGWGREHGWGHSCGCGSQLGTWLGSGDTTRGDKAVDGVTSGTQLGAGHSYGFRTQLGEHGWRRDMIRKRGQLEDTAAIRGHS